MSSTPARTGAVRRLQLPGPAPDIDLVGRRVGLTVRDVDGGPDRIGWSWAFGGFATDALRCSGTTAFLPTEHGGYTVGNRAPS